MSEPVTYKFGDSGNMFIAGPTSILNLKVNTEGSNFYEYAIASEFIATRVHAHLRSSWFTTESIQMVVEKAMREMGEPHSQEATP